MDSTNGHLFHNASESDISQNTELRDLVNDEQARVFFLINSVILNSIVSTFGVATNTVNLIVFARQGFQDTVNISLFGLAASDFGSLISLVWLSVCSNPLLIDPVRVGFVAFDVQYLTAGWPHVYFTRVTSWITAFVTFERCLCIATPLKVKTILTTKRVKICVVIIYLLVGAGVAPVYYTSRLSWVVWPDTNRTILTMTVTDDRAEVESVTYVINNVISPLGSFVVVLGCTIILVAKLNEKSKWRQQKAAVGSHQMEQNSGDATSGRDKKAIKMVTVISTIFIISFTPTTILFAYMAINPEFGAGGRFQNIFNVFFSFSFLLEAINSSVNIFVYFNMSTRFKAGVLTLISPSSSEGRKKT